MSTPRLPNLVRLLVLATAIPILWGRPAVGQQGGPRVDEPLLAASLHRYFAPIAETHDLSGTIRIERQGKVTEAWFGYADWSTRAPITAATRFGAGSIAKSMVATVALRLVRDGKLGLSESVAAYLPTYRYGDRMTIAQVLHHQAGLAREVPDSARAAFGPEGLVGWLNAREPVPGPDGRPAYSNIGYELLALIAERVSGRPYAALVDSLVFQPLSLSASSLETRVVTAAAAQPYEPGPPPSELRLARDSYLAASGSLFATAADLARWGRAVRDGEIESLIQRDSTILGSVSRKTIAGRPALWMQGSTGGGGAAVVTFPGEDVVVVIAFNVATYPLYNAEIVASEIAHGIDPGQPPTRLPATALTEEHRALRGVYDLPGAGRIQIFEADGEMRLVMVGPGWNYYLTPAGEGRLVWRTFNFTFAARRNAAGAVDGLKVRLHMLGQPTAGDSEVDQVH